jgi:hypothetical protein
MMEGARPMSAEIESYLQYLEHCDLSREEKLAILEDLWSIMQSFVDEAWGLCPSQHIANDNRPIATQLDSNKPLEMLSSFHAANTNSPSPPSAGRRRSRRQYRASKS